MVTVILVYDPNTYAVSQYTTIDRSLYPDLKTFSRVTMEEEQRLVELHNIPASGLRIFQGGGPTEESFFRWFPQFKPSS
jgi:hypothetical protein